MDGTFKSVSKQFCQVYTIHVDLGSNKEEINVTPAVFALLPNKNKATYVRLFKKILDVIPEWSPEIVNMDFEVGAIKAIEEVFPRVQVQGCFFHLSQSIWRKVQEIGLSGMYKTSQEIRNTIRQCAALAFLKPEKVEDGWLHIHSTAPDNEKLIEFFYYFVEQWLENVHIPIEMWNCHGKRHRTNNSVEGWNHKLNLKCGKPHPRVRDLVLCLKKESQNSDEKIMRAELNLQATKRKRKYVAMDDRIQRATQQFEETGDLTVFLRNVSFAVHID